METKAFKKGELIFREGDAGDCMYNVIQGRVGIVSGFGTDREKKLTEFGADQLFGEMGLLDHAPRSATAVALTDDTCVGIITEAAFGEYFREKPAEILMIMQQLSQNLRKRTNEYMDVCRSIHDLAAKEGMV